MLEGRIARKKILEGMTKGYKNHPQLERFKKYPDPLLYINAYLYQIYLEARKRGYNFDLTKIDIIESVPERIPVTGGQVDYEFQHLLNKLILRDKKQYYTIKNTKKISVNPIFEKIPGQIEEWEKY